MIISCCAIHYNLELTICLVLIAWNETILSNDSIVKHYIITE